MFDELVAVIGKIIFPENFVTICHRFEILGISGRESAARGEDLVLDKLQMAKMYLTIEK